MVILLLLSLIIVMSQAERGKLVFVQQIFRHGARNPYQATYPKLSKMIKNHQIPSYSLGKITKQGKAYQYQLGKQMYKLYGKKLFSGIKDYQQIKIYIQSAEESRTVQSAYSHLLGFFQKFNLLSISKKQAERTSSPYPGVKVKPGYAFGLEGRGFHPFQVHIDNQNRVIYTNLFIYQKCPNQSRQNFNSPFAKIISQYVPFKQAIREMEIGLKVRPGTITLSNFQQFSSNQICLSYLGKESIKLKPVHLYLQSIVSLIKNLLTQQQKRAMASSFLQATVKNIKNYINKPKQSPKMVIYSGHDTNLISIHAIFNISSAECIFQNYKLNKSNTETCITTHPQFGSVFVFEVFQYSNKTYTFKIRYNDRYYPILFCGSKECPISKLQSWVQSWKVKDLTQGCPSPNTTENQTQFHLSQTQKEKQRLSISD